MRTGRPTRTESVDMRAAAEDVRGHLTVLTREIGVRLAGSAGERRAAVAGMWNDLFGGWDGFDRRERRPPA